jgi:hypothetical protein
MCKKKKKVKGCTPTYLLEKPRDNVHILADGGKVDVLARIEGRLDVRDPLELAREPVDALNVEPLAVNVVDAA